MISRSPLSSPRAAHDSDAEPYVDRRLTSARTRTAIVHDKRDLAGVEDVSGSERSRRRVPQVVPGNVLDHVAGGIEEEDGVRVPVTAMNDLGRHR